MDIFVYAFLFLNVFRVCDYIAAGLDGKIVDPDGGIHEHRLIAQNADQISVPSVLSANGGHHCYESSHHLTMAAFMLI